MLDGLLLALLPGRDDGLAGGFVHDYGPRVLGDEVMHAARAAAGDPQGLARLADQAGAARHRKAEASEVFSTRAKVIAPSR